MLPFRMLLGRTCIADVFVSGGASGLGLQFGIFVGTDISLRRP